MTLKPLKSTLLLAGLIAGGLASAGEPLSPSSPPARPYTVAVYYWPNYHPDPFHQAKKGHGWTEWDVVKAARPRFAGHDQPKEPLWGYRDESDPRQMARSIDAMADAGVGVVLFDWYRFDDAQGGGKMLEAALERGFLAAPNRQRLRFALMWANCDYVDCHPFAPGNDFSHAPLWRKGAVGRAAFERHTGDAIKRYFTQPNYWKIQGRPYFSIYELHTLIRGLGGLEATHAALAAFRDRTKAAGFPGLHLNVIDAGLARALPLVRGQPFPRDPSRTIRSVADLLAALEVDSATMYTWVHHVSPGPEGQTTDYADYGGRAMRLMDARAQATGVAYFPHVSLGWDGSPRNYPDGIVTGNSPERFGRFLTEAKAWLDRHPESRGILTINAWNEWAEGSYLEPDKKHGMAYLDQIRDVFKKREKGQKL